MRYRRQPQRLRNLTSIAIAAAAGLAALATTTPLLAQDSIADDLKAIRDANPSRLHSEFLKELQIRSRNVSAAMHRILDSDADEEAVVAAFEQADSMLTLIGRAGYRGAASIQTQLVARLLKDDRPQVKLLGQFKDIISRARRLSALDEAAQRGLVDEFATVLSQVKVSRTHLGVAVGIARSIERYGPSREYAAATSLRLAEFGAGSDDKDVLELSAKLEGMARRLNVLGNSIKIEGVFASGEQLDWSAYRGKVVLIDYWASWCGPCIAELPNVKRMYAAYHDRGFEVLGICLDTTRTAYEKFQNDRDVPWPSLFSDADRDALGFSHPMAIHFGVTSIPTVLLVNQEGKVVSLRARGEELEKQLAELLGPVSTDSDSQTAAE